MVDQSGSVDQKIARIASRQLGLITLPQLLAVGLSKAAVAKRVERGALHRVYRGVYRVGHQAPDQETQYLAAVFACGEGAVLSGAAAAIIWGLRRGSPPPEVTTTRNRRVPGVRTHRVRELRAGEVTKRNDIPVTTPARTLVDLAARLPLDDLAEACHVAQVRYRTTANQVETVLDRRPKTKGAGNVRLIFEGDTDVFLSKLERLFLSLLKRAALPLPRTNKKKDSYYVDCRWPEQKLTVELDSYRYHHSRHAWEQDHRRAREARRRGDEFRRYTWGDVTEDGEAVTEEVAALLAR